MPRPKKEVSNTETAEFVTKEVFDEKFSSLEGSILKLVDLMQHPLVPVEAAKIATESKNIQEASADTGEVNPRYDAKVREILGERVARTFVKYPKGGGTLFTIVIKEEYSNAPKDYLERMKEDQRTVNIEREEFRGEDGVEKWAKLVLANINRPLR